MSALDRLKEYTTLVADTCEFDLITKYGPRDATTNPSLVLKAVQMPQYQDMLSEVVKEVAQLSDLQLSEKVAQVCERVVIRFGVEILKVVKGRVSSEVDARLAFDVDAQVKAAERIVRLYAEKGVDRSRVLIKLPATWEGIEAARILQSAQIDCNLTLIFSTVQAQACAEANARLVSPFVGRITDWYKLNRPVEVGVGRNDPGVRNVYQIVELYRRMGATTEIMGASFRNIHQILALVGIDLLTVSPGLMQELSCASDNLACKQVDRSTPTDDVEVTVLEQPIDEVSFRQHLNDDQMATEKLSEGVRNFAADALKTEHIIRSMLEQY